jgi:hypothetical protein
MKEREDVQIPVERIERSILFLRGQKVMLDADLAELYGVNTRVLNQAVRRNIGRFPEDVMFQLSLQEFEHVRSQFAISSCGGRRYPPYAFTDHGVAMLRTVLKPLSRYRKLRSGEPPITRIGKRLKFLVSDQRPCFDEATSREKKRYEAKPGCGESG